MLLDPQLLSVEWRALKRRFGSADLAASDQEFRETEG
jgi:hypothetical protein